MQAEYVSSSPGPWKELANLPVASTGDLIALQKFVSLTRVLAYPQDFWPKVFASLATDVLNAVG
jgi:hypothetical protein